MSRRNFLLGLILVFWILTALTMFLGIQLDSWKMRLSGKELGTDGEITLKTNTIMQQKQTLMRYLLLTSSLCSSLLLFQCGDCDDCSGDSKIVDTKFSFINNSSETIILSDCDFGNYIAPEDTLIITTKTEQALDVTMSTFVPIAQSPCQMIYATSLKCELLIFSIENYENRKQTSDNSFEFTYRFTDATLETASDCK
jgi:hypothetical protein